MRVAGRIVQGRIKIGDHEHVGDEEDYAQGAVHEIGANHRTRDGLAGVLDLFSHVG
jgi:hypothetical protein